MERDIFWSFFFQRLLYLIVLRGKGRKEILLSRKLCQRGMTLFPVAVFSRLQFLFLYVLVSRKTSQKSSHLELTFF